MKPFMLAILSVGWLWSYSQKPDPTLSLCITAAQPLGMFQSVTAKSNAYPGGSLIIMLPVAEKVPVTLGLNLSAYFLGSSSESFSHPDLLGGYTYQETSVSASMWPVHFVARVDPVKLTNFPIQPYGGLLMGFRVINSRTKADISYSFTAETDTYKKRKINLTSSYGFEFGGHIWITEKVGVDLRYALIWGGWGKYVDFESLTFDDNGDPHYQRHETRTDIRAFSVGLVWLMSD